MDLPRFGGRVRAFATSTEANDSRWEEICNKLNRRLGLDYEAWTALAAKSMRAEEYDPDGDAWH